MLGWEFPPYISGGLGTACYGLTRGLSGLGHRVIFVLPRGVEPTTAGFVQLMTPASLAAAAGHDPTRLAELTNVELRPVPAMLMPYDRPEDFSNRAAVGLQMGAGDVETSSESTLAPKAAGTRAGVVVKEGIGAVGYGDDLFGEVGRYAGLAVQMALGESFDVIHAHDWMTFPAGIAVSTVTGKPLVVQIHSTEFDRSGENVNQRIYDIERRGIHYAQRVIAVSHLTRNILLKRYAAPPEKVEVVYNAIDRNGTGAEAPPSIRRDEKIVLFLGRITMQKGPEYFLAAAKKVLEYEKNVRFIMAGSGDLVRRSIEMAAQMGIGRKVIFTGFLRGDDVARVFKMADLYVMPSVSEPFGIAPLEALANEVPVLISKQSGVSEILTHALKVDFWDVNEMANKIIAVLRHPPLQATLREHGNFEVRRLTWRVSAQGCLDVYHQAVSAMN